MWFSFAAYANLKHLVLNSKMPPSFVPKGQDVTPICHSFSKSECLKEWFDYSLPLEEFFQTGAEPVMNYYLPVIVPVRDVLNSSIRDRGWVKFTGGVGNNLKSKNRKSYYINKSRPHWIRQVIFVNGRIRRIREGKLMFISVNALKIHNANLKKDSFIQRKPKSLKKKSSRLRKNKSVFNPFEIFFLRKAYAGNGHSTGGIEDIQVTTREATVGVSGRASSIEATEVECVYMREEEAEAYSCTECTLPQAGEGSLSDLMGKDFEDVMLLMSTVSKRARDKLYISLNLPDRPRTICSPQSVLRQVFRNFNRTCQPLNFDQFFNLLYCDSCGKKNKVPPEVMLAMMTIESAGKCQAKNDGSAQNTNEVSMGLFQVNAKVHSCLGRHRVKTKANTRCLASAKNSLKMGLKIITEGYELVNRSSPQCGGRWSQMDRQEKDNWRRAVSAYNGSPRWVGRAERSIGRPLSTLQWKDLRAIKFYEKLREGGRGRRKDLTISNLAHVEAVLGSSEQHSLKGVVDYWAMWIAKQEQKGIDCKEETLVQIPDSGEKGKQVARGGKKKPKPKPKIGAEPKQSRNKIKAQEHKKDIEHILSLNLNEVSAEKVFSEIQSAAQKHKLKIRDIVFAVLRKERGWSTEDKIKMIKEFRKKGFTPLAEEIEGDLVLLTQNKETSMQNIRALAKAENMTVKNLMGKLIGNKGFGEQEVKITVDYNTSFFRFSNSRALKERLMNLAKDILGAQEYEDWMLGNMKSYKEGLEYILEAGITEEDIVLYRIRQTAKKYNKFNKDVLQDLMKMTGYEDAKKVTGLIKLARKANLESLAKKFEVDLILQAPNEDAAMSNMRELARLKKIGVMEAIDTFAREHGAGNQKLKTRLTALTDRLFKTDMKRIRSMELGNMTGEQIFSEMQKVATQYRRKPIDVALQLLTDSSYPKKAVLALLKENKNWSALDIKQMIETVGKDGSESEKEKFEADLILQSQNDSTAIRNITALAQSKNISVAATVNTLIREQGSKNQKLKSRLSALAKNILSPGEYAHLQKEIQKAYEGEIESILNNEEISEDEVSQLITETADRYNKSAEEALRILVERVKYENVKHVERAIAAARKKELKPLASQVEARFIMHNAQDPQAVSRAIRILAMTDNKVSRVEKMDEIMQTSGAHNEKLRKALLGEAFDKNFTLLVRWIKEDPKKASYLLDRKQEEAAGKVNAFLKWKLGDGASGDISYLDGLDLISSLEKGGKLDTRTKSMFWNTLIENGKFSQVTGSLEHLFSRKEKGLGLSLFNVALSADSDDLREQRYILSNLSPKLIREGKLTHFDLVNAVGNVGLKGATQCLKKESGKMIESTKRCNHLKRLVKNTFLRGMKRGNVSARMRVLSHTNALIQNGFFVGEGYFTPILVAGASGSNSTVQSYSMKMIERLIKDKKIDPFRITEQLKEASSHTSR